MGCTIIGLRHGRLAGREGIALSPRLGGAMRCLPGCWRARMGPESRSAACVGGTVCGEGECLSVGRQVVAAPAVGVWGCGQYPYFLKGSSAARFWRRLR